MADKRREPAPLTEAQIVEQAKITPDDIARARAWWKKHAPPDLRDAYDAIVSTRDELILPDAP